MAPDESTGSGISRRRLLKAGAVIGGTVWAAPVIESFTSAAMAQSEVHYCCYCFDAANKDVPTNCGQTPNAGDSGRTDDGRADGGPSTPTGSSVLDSCACFCASLGFDSYQWSGPSPNPFQLNTGTPGHISNGGAFCGCAQSGVGHPVVAQSGAASCAPAGA